MMYGSSDAAHVITLRAGIQSTFLMLMADQGPIGPLPRGTTLADARWEPTPVYQHRTRRQLQEAIAWLQAQADANPRRDLQDGFINECESHCDVSIRAQTVSDANKAASHNPLQIQRHDPSVAVMSVP